MTNPTVQVLLDNFTGAFPYDITAYLEEDSLTWTRGRPDEFSTVSAGSLTLTLDNTDSRFSLGSGTYGCDTDQQIRVKVNGTNRFTGRVQSWPVSWPGGAQTFATVTITATDDLARLSRWPLRSAIEEDLLLADPTAFYTLSEAQGATKAGDSTGTGMPSLAVTGTGSALAFGSGVGPVDGLSAVQFAGGQYLQGGGATFVQSASTVCTVEAFIATSASPSVSAQILRVGTPGTMAPTFVQLQASTTGFLQAVVFENGTAAGTATSASSGYNDGLVHHVAVTYDSVTGGGTLKLYIDGALAGTASPLSGTLVGHALTQVNIGGGDPANFNAFVGSVAHATIYDNVILTTTQIAAHSAAANDYIGETPAARLTRVAGYTGTTLGTLDTAGSTLLGPANQNGKSAADIFAEVSTATQGPVYLNGSGALTSVNGYTITQNGFADAIVGAEYVTPDTSIEADTANMVNHATGKAASSENVYTVENPTSRTLHGLYSTDYEWNVSTDGQAVDRTNWMVNTFSKSYPRAPSLSIDMQSLDATKVAQLLALDVGNFINVSGMPSQTPGGDLFLIIESIGETISETEWHLIINGSRHANSAAWLLGNGFFGVLNASTKLYF